MGSCWIDLVNNSGGDGIVIFVGLAAPVEAPEMRQPQSP